VFGVNEMARLKRLQLRTRHGDGNIILKLLHDFALRVLQQSNIGKAAVKLVREFLFKSYVGKGHVHHQIANGLIQLAAVVHTDRMER